MTIITPTVRKSLARSAFWTVGSVVAIALAVVVLLARGGSMPGGPFLGPENPAPAGAMALAQVLEEHGVSVVPADTEEQARAALDGGDATLLFHDENGYLDSERLPAITRLASHTVAIEPGFAQLRELAPGLNSAGVVEGILASDCSLAAVDRAEAVLGDGTGYRITGEPDPVHTCLGSGDDVYSLIQLVDSDRTVTVFGASAALTNERVAERGNAALALSLLGEHPTLVWYQPGIDDVAGGGPTIAELTPAWLSPVLALMVIVVIAAGVWKGRRMGPLIVEHLPVTVPAEETVEGRARLYQKASARLRALDAIRVGTVSRLASACALPRTADVSEVAAATAAVTGRSLHEIRQLLVEAHPATDRELIALSDQLLALEKSVARATRPEPTPEPGE
jgi:hypothetical protein